MPITSSTTVTLDGSHVVVHFTVQKSIIQVIAGSQLTAKFEGGKLSGCGGVNDYHASYETNKSAPPSEIKVSGFGATKRGGPPELMAQEQRFFDGLNAASGITYEDGSVALTWDNAQRSIVLRRG
ncbi:META domain-containing protein [Sorangium sp. So ce1128]